MTLDARADRTAVRLKLYANGFTPLPNKNKMSLLPGWSTIDVTPELIQSVQWAGRPRARVVQFPDTGIRCGDIIALDIDVDDKGLLNELLDALVEQGIVEESKFIRIGMPPRELWVYRTKEKIGKRTTGHFMPPNPPEDHKGFAVEILGAGCQFAAYGQRDPEHAYSWPVQSLLDHDYMDLPEITKAQADAVRDFAVLFFEMHGLERKSPAGGTDSGYTHAYDLQPDMLFEVHDLGEMTVGEIGEALRLSPPGEVWRCKVDVLRPTQGSWAGMISLVDGKVCVSDHGTYTSHFPVDADDGAALSKLGALLSERFPEQRPAEEQGFQLDVAAPDLDTRQPLDENTQRALRRYVYSQDTDQIFDIRRPRGGMKVEHFRNSMRQHYEVKMGPKGGEVRSWLSDQWMESRNRVNVRSVALRPDKPYPLFDENGEHHLNTYRPLDLPTHGDAAIGWAFLEHLLPIPAERHFFTQWLAYKFRNPEVRGPGVIMVAHDSYGTGRGSLVALIRAMVAEPLVRTIDFATLSGKTYQSQYNEWLVDSIFAVVNEAKETTPNLSSWQTRNNAYEHLKAIIDPGEHNTEVMRKGGKNGPGKTFCSILVLTNHMDSVVLPHNDRRLAILENGSPMPESYWVGFRAWLANPANVGAFRAELMAYSLEGYNPFTAPPMTAAKADMVDAGASELDRVFAEAMKRYVNTVMVKEQLVLAIEDILSESSAEVPDDWTKIVDRMFLRATRKVIGVNDRVKIEGRTRTVRLVGRPAADILTSHDSLVLEVLTHGPLARVIRSSGKIVNFPSR